MTGCGPEQRCTARNNASGLVQIQLQMLVPDGNSPATYVNELANALRLELDHNTDPKYIEAFDAAQLRALRAK